MVIVQEKQPTKEQLDKTMNQYTLNDDIFQQSLLAGLQAAEETEGVNVFLIGGGAVQWYAHDHSLRRPTVDADLQSKTRLRKAERTVWGNATIAQLHQRGLKGSYKCVRSGGEVSLEVPQGDNPFFVHLDVSTPSYCHKHEREIDECCERNRPFQLTPTSPTYAVQAPEDIMFHKLRRLIHAQEQWRLSPKDALAVDFLVEGLVDDVETGDLSKRLENAEKTRNLTLEEVVRGGLGSAAATMTRYKDEKNMYDVLLLLEAHRQKGIMDDPSLIKKSMQRYTWL